MNERVKFYTRERERDRVRQTDREIDRKTDRQADRQADRQTDRASCWELRAKTMTTEARDSGQAGLRGGW